MATQAQAPLPEKGQKVSTEVLTSNARTAQFSTRGFGGIDDPTTIWGLMIRNAPQAFGYYREIEEKDDDVGGSLEKLKLSVTKRARHVVPADDSQQAADIAKEIEIQLRDAKLHRALDFILDFPGYGLTVSELIFDVTAGQVKLVEIQDCPQELFRFGGPSEPPIGPLRLMAGPYDMSGGELVREDKFLVATYRPQARNRFGRPLMRATYWKSWFSRNAMRFWLRSAEKGNGTVAAMYPQGSDSNSDEARRALAMAEAVVNAIAVAVPENAKFVEVLLKGARTQDPAIFENLKNECKYAIVRRILGQTLTSFANEGGTGSKAMGGTHADVEEERSKELAGQVEELVNDKIVRPLVLWNFGPNAPMPKWTIDKEPATDLVERIKIDDALQVMGLPIGKKYAQETYSVAEPAGQDDVLQRTAGAAPIAADPNAPTVFARADVKREMKDVDRLLEQSGKTANDMMRARLAQIVSEVLSK